jgi:predicted nucleotide-binding protein
LPFHVRITRRSNKSHDEVKLDLSGEDLEERFLAPYRDGRSIVIGGMTIPPDDIDRIRVTETDQPSDQILPIVRRERQNSGVLVLGISDEWRVAKYGKDITDQLIQGPPGSGVTPRRGLSGPSVQGPKVVFVVHGRNEKVRDSMFSFLRSIGLHPLEWSDAIAATGRATPYIGEVLDTAFRIAQALVVLMTPNDEARLRQPFIHPGDPVHETDLTPQARANVIFEAGMAMGRYPDQTILVELGRLRPFSDIGGRHVVRLNNSTQRRQDLARRLQTAGCPVNLTSEDWHTTGNFDLDSAN